MPPKLRAYFVPIVALFLFVCLYLTYTSSNLILPMTIQVPFRFPTEDPEFFEISIPDVVSTYNASYWFSYTARTSFYWNTVDLDYFHEEDFNTISQLSSSHSNALRLKIIRSEQLWKEYYMTEVKPHFVTTRPPNVTQSPEILWNVLQPMFNCPHLVTSLGGKSVCGFEVFSISARREECAVFTFGSSVAHFETKWMLETNCKVIMFQFSEDQIKTSELQALSRARGSSNLEMYSKNTISMNNSGDSKQLRTYMQERDVAWLEMLSLELDGSEYSILEQVLSDFKEVLPFAQLIVDFHVATQNGPAEDGGRPRTMPQFVEMFARLEGRGLRPFQMQVLETGTEHIPGDNDTTIKPTVLRYSFFNLRGKHRLLVGK